MQGDQKITGHCRNSTQRPWKGSSWLQLYGWQPNNVLFGWQACPCKFAIVCRRQSKCWGRGVSARRRDGQCLAPAVLSPWPMCLFDENQKLHCCALQARSFFGTTERDPLVFFLGEKVVGDQVKIDPVCDCTEMFSLSALDYFDNCLLAACEDKILFYKVIATDPCSPQVQRTGRTIPLQLPNAPGKIRGVTWWGAKFIVALHKDQEGHAMITGLMLLVFVQLILKENPAKSIHLSLE